MKMLQSGKGGDLTANFFLFSVQEGNLRNEAKNVPQLPSRQMQFGSFLFLLKQRLQPMLRTAADRNTRPTRNAPICPLTPASTYTAFALFYLVSTFTHLVLT